MRKCLIEALEPRRLLTTTVTTYPYVDAPPSIKTAPNPQLALNASQVQTILAQAISQSIGRATGSEVAVVVDREGTVLGTLAQSGAESLPGNAVSLVTELATIRARTAAFFESDGEAFTTRTARFIIQNNFPEGVANTAGGPLYGVEFSDLIGSDILSPSLTPAISGDPGGIPLYIHGVAVGAIGVAGDHDDVAANAQLLPLTQDLPGYPANPKGRVYNGTEEYDFDEAVAQAGAKGFMAPAAIRASNIFIGGLRLPYVAEPPAHGKPFISFTQLTTGTMSVPPMATASSTIIDGTPELDNATIGGVQGLIRNRANVDMSDVAGLPGISPDGPPLPAGATPIAHTDPQGNDNPTTDPTSSDGFVSGEPADYAIDPTEPVSTTNPELTTDDVATIISQAVNQAMITRAGIRKPNGVHAEIHVVVVDLQGNVLGAFRMNDATNFSYDVAVQKARTAAFFSDDSHAFSSRAIGFMAQKYFPPAGIGAEKGPLFGLQNALNVAPTPIPGNPLAPITLASTGSYNGLANGITIFPGGFPLYKNGKLVGAIGVSGDGVDQDDLMAYTGANGYQPAANIRSDSLSASDITHFLVNKLNTIPVNPNFNFTVAKAQALMEKGLPEVRLPYAKFPRNPTVNH